jgi:Putative phage tail protein/Protein of unknown function (DUF2793)
MAEFGRAAFTIAGSFFGPWGALAGGFIGGLLFPTPGVKGPRLNELNVQHSTVGAPIPIVYGTAVLAGNIIWSGGLVEEEHEGGGGKGGPSGPTTYSYSVDLAIGICEGPISGVRRIWCDADLVYDASDDETLTERLELGGVSPGDIAAFLTQVRALSAQLNFDLYLGTEDQLPDPTIESFEGVGLVSAYRGLAYIVLPRFQLEKYGNRIPNFRFEVTTAGTPTECGIYSPGQLLPWNDGATRDPRFDEGVYQFNATGPWRDTLDEAIADSGLALVSTPLGWSETDDSTQMFPPCISVSTENVILYLQLNYFDVGSINCELDAVEEASFVCGTVHSMGECTRFYWQGKYSSQPDADQFHGFWGYQTPECSEAEIFGGHTQPGEFDCGGGDSAQYLTDTGIAIRRSLQPPDPCALGTPLAGAPGYCVVGGQVVQGITWTEVSGTFHVLQEYAQSGPAGVVTAYPVGPAVISTDPLYNDQAYWETAYAQALADGEPIAPGLVYGVDYPDTQSYAYFSECDTLDTECVPMALIVADICRRAGLRTDTSTQIDVSGLTTCVTGYIIGRQMSARDAMGPLRTFGLWDAVESDALLKFVERGHALVETLTADDLGAHENGSQPPSSMEVSRVQEKDLPRRVRLHFPNFEHDHEVSEQYASRFTTEAIDEIDIELPVSMDPDTAKQLAEVMLNEAWVSRNGYRFTFDNTWLALEPTDCVEIPVDGQTERVRIVSVDYSIGGLLKIEAVRDDDGAYVSTAVAVPGTPSGGVPGSSGGGPICPSAVVLLDIPRLRESDTDAGYYAAIYGLCPDFWRCAELYRSNDGGATYQRVARTDFETTVGEIVSITGPDTDPVLPGESPAYDAGNSITVTLFEGTLASVSDEQIAAGQNLAAIGVDGRWVIIQFKTATLDTGDQWTLTDLIWGVNDTEHLLGTTVAGDTFVLLSDGDLLRISESADAIGVEKQFKILSCGESIDAVEEFDFTSWGLSYQRLCPSTVLSASITTPPVSPADGDAYLLPNDTSLSGVWATHGGEIAKWSDETDSWVYCIPAPGTIIHVIDEEDSSGDGGDYIGDGDGGYTPAPWARSTATFLTRDDERTPLPNSLRLVGVDGITLTESTDGELEIGGGGGATALDDLTDVTIDTSLAEGDTLVYRGTQGWVNEPPDTGGGARELVASHTVTGSAVSTFSVSGLDLHGDERYTIELELLVSSSPNISLYYNADTTATNYDVQGVEASGTSVGAGRANNGVLLTPVANDTVSIDGELRINVENRARFLYRYSAGDAASVKTGQGTHAWRTAATNVTGITISASIATSILVASRLSVYRT